MHVFELKCKCSHYFSQIKGLAFSHISMSNTPRLLSIQIALTCFKNLYVGYILINICCNVLE